nr:uncharacterized protein LOC112769689 [Arachis hypogaea]
MAMTPKFETEKSIDGLRRINDIYLSRKQRNGNIYMFAFIRYTTKGGALKAIAEMNPLRLRGKNIFVGEARYRRKAEPAHKPIGPEGANLQQHTAQKTHKEVVPIDAVPDGHASRAEKDGKDPHGNGWTKKVEVEVAKKNLE